MKKYFVLAMLIMSLIVPAISCAIGPIVISGHRVTCDSTADPVSGNYVYFSQVISSISKANPGVVITASPHGLISGVKVLFQGIAGMVELNGKITTVTVINTTALSIGIDTSSYGTYTGSGGVFDDGHRAQTANINVTPYDLLLLITANGNYRISASFYNASGDESGLSNVIPFSITIPGSPTNIRTQ